MSRKRRRADRYVIKVWADGMVTHVPREDPRRASWFAPLRWVGEMGGGLLGIISVLLYVMIGTAVLGLIVWSPYLLWLWLSR